MPWYVRSCGQKPDQEGERAYQNERCGYDGIEQTGVFSKLLMLLISKEYIDNFKTHLVYIGQEYHFSPNQKLV